MLNTATTVIKHHKMCDPYLNNTLTRPNGAYFITIVHDIERSVFRTSVGGVVSSIFKTLANDIGSFCLATFNTHTFLIKPVVTDQVSFVNRGVWYVL